MYTGQYAATTAYWLFYITQYMAFVSTTQLGDPRRILKTARFCGRLSIRIKKVEVGLSKQKKSIT